jgi:hypothetical protein
MTWYIWITNPYGWTARSLSIRYSSSFRLFVIAAFKEGQAIRIKRQEGLIAQGDA